MVDGSLNQIENAKTHQHTACKQFSGPPQMAAVRGAPQQDETEHHKYVRRGVEDAVKQGIEFKIGNGVGRISRACHHVMPLQNLVQDNPVEKPSQAKAEENSSRGRKPPL